MDVEHKMDRVAIVNKDKCKPKKCGLECKKICPVNMSGKECIDVSKISAISKISEELCIGCGQCVRVCPYKAITIVNLPKGLHKDLVHQYGPNSFRLHRLPVIKPGQILGLVGSNGIGKTTALKILCGKINCNFGVFEKKLMDIEVINNFKGSELQSFFTKLFEFKLKVAIKPQYVDEIPKKTNATVGGLLKNCGENVIAALELEKLRDRKVSELSGGELQRFAIAYTCSKEADIYIFDEPTSYLDVKQRIAMANLIRSLSTPKNYIIVVEHDLSILDYLSDYICCFYGESAIYGVCTVPYNVREGINVFLDGYIPTENVRFRDTVFNFTIQQFESDVKKKNMYVYPAVKKMNGNFSLEVESGEFSDSQIIVLLGQNGTGKTTFIKTLIDSPLGTISYKPQIMLLDYEGTVKELFYDKIVSSFVDPQFQTDIVKPLCIGNILDNKVSTLSGGELQKVAIILCLGKSASIYLIDEPSAYLDSEQRIVVSKIIKQFVMHNKKTAFVVEHDFIMATYLADRVILFDGTPSVSCVAHRPQNLVSGMNAFLRGMNITFRRDPKNGRPRINKFGSVKDKEQKDSGKYFVVE